MCKKACPCRLASQRLRLFFCCNQNNSLSADEKWVTEKDIHLILNQAPFCESGQVFVISYLKMHILKPENVNPQIKKILHIFYLVLIYHSRNDGRFSLNGATAASVRCAACSASLILLQPLADDETGKPCWVSHRLHDPLQPALTWWPRDFTNAKQMQRGSRRLLKIGS